MAEEGGDIELQQCSNSSNNLPTQHHQTPVIRTTGPDPQYHNQGDSVKTKMDSQPEELDIVDRDPTSLNTHVRVSATW